MLGEIMKSSKKGETFLFGNSEFRLLAHLAGNLKRAKIVKQFTLIKTICLALVNL